MQNASQNIIKLQKEAKTQKKQNFTLKKESRQNSFQEYK